MNVREGGVAVIQRSKHLVDVFTGTGWDNRSLYGYKQGQLTLLKGNPISKEEAAVVLSALAK